MKWPNRTKWPDIIELEWDRARSGAMLPPNNASLGDVVFPPELAIIRSTESWLKDEIFLSMLKRTKL